MFVRSGFVRGEWMDTVISQAADRRLLFGAADSGHCRGCHQELETVENSL